MTTSVFVLGLLLGFQHAFEADHIGAVVGMKGRSSQTNHLLVRKFLSNAGHWAIGHGLVLILAAIVVYTLNLKIPASIKQASEVAVGIILCLFGGRFFKPESRSGSNSPFSPQLAGPSADSSEHKPTPGWRTTGSARALLFGMLHGFAGSGVLFIILATTGGDRGDALFHILIFSLGTLGGMMLISLFIAWPMSKSATALAGHTKTINRIIGSVLLLIGGSLIYGNLEIVSNIIAGWITIFITHV